MSRAGDLYHKLPDLLNKYPESTHQAIVETFADMLEEGWDDDYLNGFLDAGKGISKTADDYIEKCRQWLVGE